MLIGGVGVIICRGFGFECEVVHTLFDFLIMLSEQSRGHPVSVMLGFFPPPGFSPGIAPAIGARLTNPTFLDRDTAFWLFQLKRGKLASALRKSRAVDFNFELAPTIASAGDCYRR